MNFDRIKRNIPIVILLLMLSSMAFICIDAERDNPNDPGSSGYGVNKIYLFNAGTDDGRIGAGGKSGADAICRGHVNRPAACTVDSNCFAFISVDTDNEIQDLPDSIPDGTFYGPDGITKIADNWADILDGNIDERLDNADVLPTLVHWWSGSNSDGSLNANNCLGWETLAAENGARGESFSVSNTWISFDSDSCAVFHYVLCICY
jgi:hypothetical protein